MREEPGAHADQVPAVVRRLHAPRGVLQGRNRRQEEGRALEKHEHDRSEKRMRSTHTACTQVLSVLSPVGHRVRKFHALCQWRQQWLLMAPLMRDIRRSDLYATHTRLFRRVWRNILLQRTGIPRESCKYPLRKHRSSVWLCTGMSYVRATLVCRPVFTDTVLTIYTRPCSRHSLAPANTPPTLSALTAHTPLWLDPSPDRLLWTQTEHEPMPMNDNRRDANQYHGARGATRGVRLIQNHINAGMRTSTQYHGAREAATGCHQGVQRLIFKITSNTCGEKYGTRQCAHS